MPRSVDWWDNVTAIDYDCHLLRLGFDHMLSRQLNVIGGLATRSMHTPVKHKFFVYAPDKEGALELRLSVRPKHLEGINKPIADGVIPVAGALLTPDSIESPDSPKKMLGSMLIIEAENIEQVKEMMTSDIYYTSGVWDPEKLVIAPMVIATPFP